MIQNIKIDNNTEIESLLKNDIKESNKNVKIFAGHLPLVYESKEELVYIDEFRWGEFSTYTFDLGAKLLRYTLDIGKKGQLIIVVDDDIELTINSNLINSLDDQNWRRRERRKIFKNPLLPKPYEKILEKYNLNLSHLVAKKQRKVNTFLLSEKVLKTEAKELKISAPNACSLAYKGLLLNPKLKYFDIINDYHISLMPGQCKGNICEGFFNQDYNLNASFIFFPHIEKLGGIIPDSIGYKKTDSIKPISIKESLKNGYITYFKTTYNTM